MRDPRLHVVHLLRVRPALRLELAEGKAVVGTMQVIVVDRHRLLEHGAIAPERRPALHHGGDMRHVAPAHQARRVGEAGRVPVGGRAQQQRGRVDGAARDDDDGRGVPLGRPVPFHLHRVHPASRRVGQQPPGARAGQDVDRSERRRRPDAALLRFRLRIEVARKRVARVAEDAVRPGRRQAERQRRRVEPHSAQPFDQRLDVRVVRHGRIRIGVTRRIGRIRTRRAMHQVATLGPVVVGRQRGVIDRPGGRGAVDVLDFAEVLRAHPEEDGAPELRVPADAIVHVGPERAAAAIQPALVRAVAQVLPDRLRAPVRLFPGDEAAPLQDQDPRSGGRQRARQRAAADSAADDDDVPLPRRRMRRGVRRGHGRPSALPLSAAAAICSMTR